MDFFLCKCDKNQKPDEKTAIDLLNIKNLEKSLKNKEKKKLKEAYNSNRNSVSNDNLNISGEELEIIEYPYSNNENNKRKNIYSNQKIKKRNNIQLSNLPKTNDINRHNNLFNNNVNNNNKDDLNITSSSLNNESLIIDDIEYLNDEDTMKMPQKIIKKNEQNLKKIKDGKTSIYMVNNNKKKQDNCYSFTENNALRNSFKTGINNDSLSIATKLSLNENNKQKIDKCCLSQRKEDKKYIKKITNYKKFNILNNKSLNKNKKAISLNNSNTINNNKRKLINGQLYKISVLGKDNNKIIGFNNKRINKRKINFKKVNLDLNNSKNKSYNY